jgi:hypothetical protein
MEKTFRIGRVSGTKYKFNERLIDAYISLRAFRKIESIPFSVKPIQKIAGYLPVDNDPAGAMHLDGTTNNPAVTRHQTANSTRHYQYCTSTWPRSFYYGCQYHKGKLGAYEPSTLPGFTYDP